MYIDLTLQKGVRAALKGLVFRVEGLRFRSKPPLACNNSTHPGRAARWGQHVPKLGIAGPHATWAE